ncbi:2-dehydropantoate 2-reductase [Cytobacillus spongiae]|uniref:2-dehydropantoate 2-reductase n=1 Tax=Cytobacillus spongiae TaxID=2901381 RepID=UPI001F1B75DE|nr:2-dehydropantoate 2-reductase [Cytobacillus spongiae]UII57307.1 2-dehydropantoate 2-reductase [Cytobacillus spongiae]
MKIAIVGGGSIGLLFAYYLNQKNEVIVYTRSLEQAKLIEEEGLFIEIGNNEYLTKVRALPFSEWRGDEDLTFVTVKQYHLPNVLDRITSVKSDKPILFLQNGMGHLKGISSLEHWKVYVGIVDHGALRMKSNFVKHTGMGMTKISPIVPSDNGMIDWLLASSSSEFPFYIEEGYENILLNKLVVNGVVNPLTAILKVPNGELISNPHFHNLFQQLFDEICLILGLQDKEKYYRYVKEVCEKTAGNRSSMLKDLEENRRTEVDAILGYLLERATAKNLQSKLITSYYHSIKGQEYRRGE